MTLCRNQTVLVARESTRVDGGQHANEAKLNRKSCVAWDAFSSQEKKANERRAATATASELAAEKRPLALEIPQADQTADHSA